MSNLWVAYREPDDGRGASFGVTYRDYDTEVDTIAQLSGFPVPFEARYRGHGWTYSATGWWRPTERFRLSAGWDFADIDGDNPYKRLRTYGATEYEFRRNQTLRFSVNFHFFDDSDEEADDFESTVYALTFEQRF